VPGGEQREEQGMSDRLVWIDCEMTGLDLGSDLLIEVAALVTDSELNQLGEGIDIVIGADAEQLSRMPDVVREMHASSGLTDEVLASTVTLQEAEQRVLDFIKQHVPEPNKAPLCGNSIATDRGFLTRDMPLLDEWLHYRMVDVSSVKELARRPSSGR
jgi:oligoribonuclease